jgi:hypothetical protein
MLGDKAYFSLVPGLQDPQRLRECEYPVVCVPSMGLLVTWDSFPVFPPMSNTLRQTLRNDIHEVSKFDGAAALDIFGELVEEPQIKEPHKR